MKTAFILEDIPEARAMLGEVVSSAFPGVAIGTVASVAAAHAMLEDTETHIDLALVDLVLPDGNGVEIIAALTRKHPGCTIVVATIFDDDDHLFPALRAGAHGYLLKEQPREILVRQLHGITEGQPPLSPAIARRLLRHFQATAESAHQQTLALTPREREVLTLLARGIRIAEIAESLGISRHTVGDHVKSIYRKLNISSRAEAALQARTLGLV